MLEGSQALKDMEKIIDDPNIDIVYVGTYDLSVSLGLKGDADHPDVISALEDAVSRIRKKGKAAGCMINDAAGLKRFKELGIQFICYKVDTAMIHDSVSGIVQELKK
jgi:4-hydroxy-2-oxoheptanedioate aldolase